VKIHEVPKILQQIPQLKICEAAGEPARGLDVWEQEVEEAIQAMSEPIQDGEKG
jgi:predicted transcriptional regulator